MPVFIPTRAPTTGQQLANQIHADIQQRQIPPGALIASITELQERFAAGRPTIKQAVRILEQRGIAHMKRGVGGGLLASAPSAAFAARALSIQLEHDFTVTATRFPLDEQAPGLGFLQVGCLHMAIEHYLYLQQVPLLHPDQCRALEQLAHKLNKLDDTEFLRAHAHRQLYHAIRVVADDPVINLAQQTAHELAVDLIPYSLSILGQSRQHPTWQITRRTADAVIAADIPGLFRCLSEMMVYLQESWNEWQAIAQNPALLPRFSDQQQLLVARPEHKAEQLAREILREARLQHWQAGERLGSGVELMARYQTGADTLRQAILILQEHGVLEVELGRNGGLTIAPPNRQGGMAAAQYYLAQKNASALSVRGFIRELALQSFDSFPQRPLPQLHSSARHARTLNSTAPEQGWQKLLCLCDNTALSLFYEVFKPYLPTLSTAAIDLILTQIIEGKREQGRRLLANELRDY